MTPSTTLADLLTPLPDDTTEFDQNDSAVNRYEPAIALPFRSLGGDGLARLSAPAGPSHNGLVGGLSSSGPPPFNPPFDFALFFGRIVKPRAARSSPLTFRRFGHAINTDEVFGTHK